MGSIDDDRNKYIPCANIFISHRMVDALITLKITTKMEGDYDS